MNYWTVGTRSAYVSDLRLPPRPHSFEKLVGWNWNCSHTKFILLDLPGKGKSLSEIFRCFLPHRCPVPNFVFFASSLDNAPSFKNLFCSEPREPVGLTVTSSEMDGSGNCCPYVRPKISFPSRSSFFYGRSVHVKATFFFLSLFIPYPLNSFVLKRTIQKKKQAFDGCSGSVYTIRQRSLPRLWSSFQSWPRRPKSVAMQVLRNSRRSLTMTSFPAPLLPRQQPPC